MFYYFTYFTLWGVRWTENLHGTWLPGAALSDPHLILIGFGSAVSNSHICTD